MTDVTEIRFFSTFEIKKRNLAPWVMFPNRAFSQYNSYCELCLLLRISVLQSHADSVSKGLPSTVFAEPEVLSPNNKVVVVDVGKYHISHKYCLIYCAVLYCLYVKFPLILRCFESREQ